MTPARRRRWLWTLAAAALGAAFLAGRATAPQPIAARQDEATVAREATASQAARAAVETARTQQAAAVRTRTVRVPVLLDCPAGGTPLVATKEVTTTESASLATREGATATRASGSFEGSREAGAARSLEASRAERAWRAHLLAGARFGTGDAPRAIVGAALERRLAGPLSAGLWGAAELPAGVGGLAAPVGGSVGVSLAVEW